MCSAPAPWRRARRRQSSCGPKPRSGLGYGLGHSLQGRRADWLLPVAATGARQVPVATPLPDMCKRLNQDCDSNEGWALCPASCGLGGHLRASRRMPSTSPPCRPVGPHQREPAGPCGCEEHSSACCPPGRHAALTGLAHPQRRCHGAAPGASAHSRRLREAGKHTAGPLE